MNAPILSTTYRYPRTRWLRVREDDAPQYGAADETAGEADDEDAPPQPDPQTISDWKAVHVRIVELAAERAAHERELCRWLLAAERLKVAERAGYASVREYVERVVGLKGRHTEERLRMGHALAELPALDGALAAGELCFSAVRELTRVAVPRTDEEWRDWAKGKSARQIEKAVAQRRSGDSPTDPPDPSLVKHRLSFEVSAETMALFRDLQARVRTALGSDAGVGAGAVDDDMLLYEIARRALAGPGDEGRASYQVAVTRCDGCGELGIDAGGVHHLVDAAVAEMVACDSQELGDVDGAEGSSPHVGAPKPARRARATQSTPPATRRKVLRRDGGRCVFPGCANHLFLDVHHIDPRAESGRHDPDRMATTCGAHHRGVHRGAVVIEGSASGGFVFRHADGTPYGEPLRPAAIDMAQQVFSALRHMGFKETEARRRIDAARQAGAVDSVESLLRAALLAT